MKINRKIQNFGLIIAASLALIGFIVGCFLDQKITGKMGDSHNLFGILLTAFGPVLTLAFGVFAGALLCFMPTIQNKTWNIIFRVIGAVAVGGFAFSQIKEGIDYVDFPRMQAEKNTWVALIIAFIVLLDLAIVLFSKIWVKKMDQEVLISICLMIISIILIYFVAGEIVKYLASRPRPRVLDQGRLYFKNWYEWKPLAALLSSEYKDCKSFVSGHAANAGCLITILPLVSALPKQKNDIRIQIGTIVIGTLFVFVVAFSRIVARAHWMTDVMGGIILSCGIQALVINLTPTILKKLQ